MNKTAEYYVKHSSEIDLTKGTYVPEAPRIQRLTTTDGGHSEQVANSLAKEKPGRLVGSPKKASPSKKVKKTGMSLCPEGLEIIQCHHLSADPHF